MQKKRSRGILMHVSTLDGDFGCGSFGKEARAFVDLLHESGYEYWQTLPFGVPDASGSPYKSFSAFAGNPLFIDLPTLHENGLLTSSELEDEKMRYSRAPHIYKCDFEALTESRYALLRDVAARIKTENASLRASVEAFAESHPYLDGFCRYMSEVRTEIMGGVHTGTPTSPADELFFYRFTQYEFFRQWQEIKKYAGENGVKIIGDIPIYVDLDSADVWQNPQYFDLDENKRPVKVAGVPPDYFSPEGQKWGNPVYDWDALGKDGFSWWIDRIKWQLEIFDGIRIDHFRGLSAYYVIPVEDETAINGEWRKGPGMKLVQRIKDETQGKLIIAEDLGIVDDDTVKLLKDSGFPGMKVFQFAFSEPNSPHLPHNYPENCVAYSGTHDNTTLLAYTLELDWQTRTQMMDYIGYDSNPATSGDCVLRTISRSRAFLVIFPIQDILGFGCDTRMNTPGVAEGNWTYRVTAEQLASINREYRRHVGRLYGRC